MGPPRHARELDPRRDLRRRAGAVRELQRRARRHGAEQRRGRRRRRARRAGAVRRRRAAALAAFGDFARERVPTSLGRPIATLERIQSVAGEARAQIIAGRARPEPRSPRQTRRRASGCRRRLGAREAADLPRGDRRRAGHRRGYRQPRPDPHLPFERHLRDVLCARPHPPQDDAALARRRPRIPSHLTRSTHRSTIHRTTTDREAPPIMSTTHRYRTPALAALAAASVLVMAGCARQHRRRGGDGARGRPRRRRRADRRVLARQRGVLVRRSVPDLLDRAPPGDPQRRRLAHRSGPRDRRDRAVAGDRLGGQPGRPDLHVQPARRRHLQRRHRVHRGFGGARAARARRPRSRRCPGAYGGVYVSGYDSSDRHRRRHRRGAASPPRTPRSCRARRPPTWRSSRHRPTRRRPKSAASATSSAPDPSCSISTRPARASTFRSATGYAWASELNAHQGEAYLDAVHINYVAEDSVRVGNLASGASDIAWPRNPFTPEDRGLLESGGATIESRSLPGPSQAYYPNVSRRAPAVGEGGARCAADRDRSRDVRRDDLRRGLPSRRGRRSTRRRRSSSARRTCSPTTPRRPARSSTTPAGCSRTAPTTAPATARR